MPERTIAPLGPTHAVDGFVSGDLARDNWLRTRALSNQVSGDSRTYVLLDTDGSVSGYYALTVSSVLRSLLPGAMRRNAPDPVSCVVLAQLAVSSQSQGQGLSQTLVMHAMNQVLRLADIAGYHIFTVHPARPALVIYYQRFGFDTVQASPPLMAMSLASVRRVVLIPRD